MKKTLLFLMCMQCSSVSLFAKKKARELERGVSVNLNDQNIVLSLILTTLALTLLNVK